MSATLTYARLNACLSHVRVFKAIPATISAADSSLGQGKPGHVGAGSMIQQIIGMHPSCHAIDLASPEVLS